MIRVGIQLFIVTSNFWHSSLTLWCNSSTFWYSLVDDIECNWNSRFSTRSVSSLSSALWNAFFIGKNFDEWIVKWKKEEAELVWNLLRFLTIISNLYGSLAVFDSSVFEMLTRFPFELYNLSRSLAFASAAALNVSELKRKSRFWKSLLEMKKAFLFTSQVVRRCIRIVFDAFDSIENFYKK